MIQMRLWELGAVVVWAAAWGYTLAMCRRAAAPETFTTKDSLKLNMSRWLENAPDGTREKEVLRRQLKNRRAEYQFLAVVIDTEKIDAGGGRGD